MQSDISEIKKRVEFHFNDPQTSEEKDGQISQSAWVPFVSKGAVLVSLIPLKNSEKKGKQKKKYILSPKQHTELADLSLVASCSGYPMLSINQEKDTCEIAVSITPILQLTKDNMFAAINLYPQQEPEGLLTVTTIEKCLAEEQIVNGVDWPKIRDSLEHLNQKKEPVIDTVIARGTLPQNGQDAQFSYHIDIGPLPGTLQKGDRIDFRERKIFVGVDQGQLIATKVPPTAGTPGRNIHGKELPAKPGRDIIITSSGDVDIDLESGDIRAKCAGVVSITNGNNIKVSEKQVISGNVDYATGNIETKNSIEISGTVTPGFKVVARSDIAVGGNVENSHLKTKANATLKSGLIGTEGVVRARGDVDIHFIQWGKIEAGGTVTIRKEAYYCTILADGDIHCDENSKILAGTLLCGGSFLAGTVGSFKSKPAIIAAGVNYSRYLKKTKLEKKLEKLQLKVLKLQQRHGRKAHTKSKYKKISDEFLELTKTNQNLNLIPGTPELSLNEPFMNHSLATITVTGKVEAGTTIRIGNKFLVLESRLSGVVFQLDDRAEMIIYRQL